MDHFHARGFPAVDLADHLPIKSTDHVLDIGCGIGGPARYFAKRFGCRVSGVDITGPFIDAANKLTALLGMTGQVSVEQGDALLVVPGRDVRRRLLPARHDEHPGPGPVLRRGVPGARPGAFFGLTEHRLGPVGDPYHPLPWSEDGTRWWLATPEDTVERLSGAGFVDIDVQHSGPKYIAAYGQMIAAAERGELPTLGIHILLGDNALQKARNSKRSIEEGRTHPIQVICRKPS